MNMSDRDNTKLQAIIENVFTFTSQQIGVASGATTGYEKTLMELRKSTALFSNALQSESVTSEIIDDFEAKLQAAVVTSPTGLFSSFESPNINQNEIKGIIDFLDSIRGRLE